MGQLLRLGSWSESVPGRGAGGSGGLLLVWLHYRVNISSALKPGFRFTSLPAIFQIVAFAIITDLYRTSRYPPFEYARPSEYLCLTPRSYFLISMLGTAYVLNTISWVMNVIVVFGVVTTGISADAGHEWAAGNRAYRPVDG